MTHATSFTSSYAGDPVAALVLSRDEAGARPAVDAIHAVGARLLAITTFDEAAARLGDQARLDLLVVELACVEEATLPSLLEQLAHEAAERAIPLVASFEAHQIDAVATGLIGHRAQLLCAPTPAERVAAIALARSDGVWLNDAGRETETERLRKLNEEVARIAETLARLTRAEPASPHAGVRARTTDYRGPDSEPDPAPDVTAAEIRAAIRARRLRDQFFDSELFADPAWDMLLDLYAAHLEGLRVSVSSLCIAAAVPPTTALRWITTMHDAGLFERQADAADRRRAYIALSAKGREVMQRYIAGIRRAGLSIP
jgi:DNA-binding MarR family transcriptional regulator